MNIVFILQHIVDSFDDLLKTLSVPVSDEEVVSCFNQSLWLSNTFTDSMPIFDGAMSDEDQQTTERAIAVMEWIENILGDTDGADELSLERYRANKKLDQHAVVKMITASKSIFGTIILNI